KAGAVPGGRAALHPAIAAGHHVVALAEHFVERRIAARAARFGARHRIRNGQHVVGRGGNRGAGRNGGRVLRFALGETAACDGQAKNDGQDLVHAGADFTSRYGERALKDQRVGGASSSTSLRAASCVVFAAREASAAATRTAIV